MSDKAIEQVRKEFEEVFPEPTGSMWDHVEAYYISTVGFVPNFPNSIQNIRWETWQAAKEQYAPREVDDFHSEARDAKRYRYIKKHMEWRRSSDINEPDSHAFVGCRFPYLANFTCATMLDHNIDKMMEPQLGDKE